MNESRLQEVNKRLGKSLLYILLIMSGAVMIVPFAWMLSTSLKGGGAVLTMPPQ